MRPALFLAACLAALLTGCATLGPTPVTTGLSAIPADRPRAEVQVGALPGYYLSEAVVEVPGAEPQKQGTVLIDLERYMGADTGLVVGGRLVGPSHDTQAEPILGVRQSLDRDGLVSLAGFLSGTHASATKERSHYEATRVAAEIGLDVQLTRRSQWLELHLVAGATGTYLDARGDYCMDEERRYGVDCDETQELTHATLSGIFPAATVGAAVHVARLRNSAFHGARMLLVFAAGSMPRVIAGEQTDAEAFTSVGLALSLGFGSRQ